MNKLLKRIATTFLGFAMAAGVGVAVGYGAKGSSEVLAADEVYKSVTFTKANQKSSVNNYTSSWDATDNNFSVTLQNFNNNSNGWDYVKCGRKNNDSVGTITTKAVIDKAITKVTISIDGILDTSKVNSMKLYSKTSNGSWTEQGSFTAKAGDQSVTISSPAENLFYKAEFDCASHTSNGIITISKIQYFIASEAPAEATVTIDTPSISTLPVGYVASTILEATSDGFTGTVTYTWSAITNGSYVTLTQDPSDGSKCTVSSKGTNDSGNVVIQVSATDNESTDTETVTITLVATNTVAQSIAATPSSGKSSAVYTHGFVNGYYKTSTGFVTNKSQAADITSSGQAKFFISDDGEAGSASTRIEAFNCFDLNKTAFEEYPDLGTEVVIYGTLELYGSIYEHSANCFLVYKAVPTYSVSYNPNGGSGEMSDTNSYEKGTSVTIQTNTFTNPQGKHFTGWKLNNAGELLSNGTSFNITGDTEIYAQWDWDTFSVTWKNYDGSTIKTDSNVNYGTTPSYTGNTPTKPSTDQYHYEFSGWSPAPSALTANAEYTAQFDEILNSFTVSGTITNGSLSSSANVNYGSALNININPSTARYTYPESITSVKMGNDYLSEGEGGYEYTPSTGAFSIASVIGNIEIVASCKDTWNTYSITTTVTNGTYTGSTSITDHGGVASVTIAPTGDYKLPDTVSVDGASHTYNSTTGVISLSGATSNVVIGASMVALTPYSITVNASNGTYTGPGQILELRSATIVFTPEVNYGNPDDVDVINATKSWDNGTLVLSNPTGNVTVTYVAAKNELDFITISPESGSYILGEDFVKPTVTAHYTIAEDAVIDSSNISFTGYNPYVSSETAQDVTISYTEDGITKTTVYKATVSSKSTAKTYELVTDASTLKAGDKIIFTNEDSSEAMLKYDGSGNNCKDTSKSGETGITLSGTTITNPGTAGIFTLSTASTTDGTFYLNDGTYYMFAASSSSNNFKGKASTDSSNGAFKFTYSTSKMIVYAYGSSNRNYLYYNSNSSLFSCYVQSDYTKYEYVQVYKEITQVGDLIRITAEYNGGEKFVGDTISASDFTVKKQLNTSNTLVDVTSGFTLSASTLSSTSNTITISYQEGNVTKTADVVVMASERQATVSSVTLVQGENVVKSYIDWSGSSWDYTDLTVHCVWSDSTFNEDLNLSDLVQSGDATVLPAKPSVGDTSFTVSYTYHGTTMTNNVVSGITIVADYITNISWTGTTASHFKAFSGSQLTVDQVNAWNVVPTFAGAGESTALSFGSYTLKVGEKTISALPYTWQSEDDGQALSITYGKDVNGNDFVKTNSTAVANICASINSIEHTESETVITPVYEYTSTTSLPSGSNTVVIAAKVSNNYYALDAIESRKGTKYTAIVSNGKITNENATSVWTLTQVTGGYTITDSSGKYLAYSTSTDIILQDESYIWSVSTVTSNGHFRFASGTTGRGLHYRAGSVNKFGGYSTSNVNGTEYFDLELFIGANTGSKEETKDVTTEYANQMAHFDTQKAVVAFAKFMNATMNGQNVCSGTFEGLGTAWGTVASKYAELITNNENLSSSEKEWANHMLQYATAQWGSDEEAACVEKAMKTYDHCVKKYSLTEFLDGVRAVQAPYVSSLVNVIGKNTNIVAIIVIISMVSMSAIGGYFFLRKRKEQ